MVKYDRFKIGLVGFGIGKVYAAAFRAVELAYPDLPKVELTGIATASQKSGQQAIQAYGFRWGTNDYRELIANEEINTLVLAAPNDQHYAMLQAALPSGKAIYTEKPLTSNLDQARSLVRLARETGSDAQVAFMYRFTPALRQAKAWIDEGRLGRVYSFRAEYFRASYVDPGRSLRWKARAAQTGGALDDLGSHLIDMVTWLVGPIERVAAQKRTFVSERPDETGVPAPVETDDHVWVQASLPDGGVGTIEAGRMISGAVNDVKIEIFGSDLSLRWSPMDGNYLYVADGPSPAERMWRRAATVQKYPGALVPPADHPVGLMRAEIEAGAEFIRRTLAGQPYDPGLEQGARVQAVIEAAHRAAGEGAWVNVEPILV